MSNLRTHLYAKQAIIAIKQNSKQTTVPRQTFRPVICHTETH